MNFDMTYDHLLQSVSNAINQFQPNYGNFSYPDEEEAQKLTVNRAVIENRIILLT
jgi:hypothetical protein